MADTTQRFIKLVQRFVYRKIDAEQFADEAVDFWIQHTDLRQGNNLATEVIGKLCLEADALSNEPPFNATSEQLLEIARDVLSELLDLQIESKGTSGGILLQHAREFDFAPGEVDKMMCAIEDCEKIDWDEWK